MILILTGNGKGKTTSALGTAMRASGWGGKIAIVFFDKGGDHYGEAKILECLKDKIDVFRFGLPRFDEASETFRFNNVPGDITQAQAGLGKVRELYTKNYFLIIADELINCLNLDLVKKEDVRSMIEDCPENTHLLLTGRNVPEWLAEKADLISEVNNIKHYFDKGDKAIKGLDF
jgi:cob(I)alamin adenosyltransferase